MFESLVKAFAAQRVYAKTQSGGLACLQLIERPLKFGEAGHRYKFRAQLPSGTRCEITHDSSIDFISMGDNPSTLAAYVVLA